MDRGAHSPWVHKESDTTEQLSTQAPPGKPRPRTSRTLSRASHSKIIKNFNDSDTEPIKPWAGSCVNIPVTQGAQNPPV